MKTYFDKEYKKLLNYTRRQLRGISSIQAEDILHEVAFNVINKIDFETTIENIAAYIYKSIRNKISDVLRKPKRTVSLSSVDAEKDSLSLLEKITIDTETIDQIIENQDINRQINHALQDLSYNYKQIIIATEFEGKTIKELSREWGVPMGTLLSRRHRALAKLQSNLKTYI